MAGMDGECQSWNHVWHSWKSRRADMRASNMMHQER
jgi:hypothetical protein